MLQIVDGQRYYSQFFPHKPLIDAALREINALDDSKFDWLSNPFESKMVIKDKFKLPDHTATLISILEAQALRLARVFNVPSLVNDKTRHYAGVFRYPKDGYLFAHVDAGIHPIEKLRKHITAVCYLGNSDGGELEFWNGDNASGDDPKLYGLIDKFSPDHGRVVYFENNDYAWHAAAPNEGDVDRIVVTVSYLSEEVDGFDNKRERAFFAPRPGEIWTPEMRELRNKRADKEQYSSVYRV